MAKLKIAGATLNQTPLDWTNNVQNIIRAIGKAREKDVDLLCFQELVITSYGCEDLFLSEWLPLKSLSFISEIARESTGMTVVIGTPFRLNGSLYNTSCIIQDGKVAGFIAKQHLANDGVHYEPRWFTAWKPGEVVEVDFNGEQVPFGDFTFHCEGIQVGMEICEDAWVAHEKRPACRLLEKKVDLILNPSASHFAMGKSDVRWNIALNSSKNFNCAYLHVNALGNEAGRMIYDGEILLAYQGKMIARNEYLSYQDQVILDRELDFNSQDQEELHYQEPDLNEEFIKASSLALFDYLRKSKSRGFVLSLSGGADSSSCAVIVSEMVRRGLRELGLQYFLSKIHRLDLSDKLEYLSFEDQARVVVGSLLTCAYQASINSSEDTFRSAEDLATSMGANFYFWDIDDEVESYTQKIEKAIGRKLTWEHDDIALQNIQSRARSPIIWMLANIQNSLLITTSNRSEGDVGYATMDGDTSGSIAPIAAVHKHFIRQWLKWAEKALNYPALSRVNSLSPAAELRPREYVQTDESDLMPYHILVEIERLAIRDYKSPMEVYKTLCARDLEPPDLLREHVIKFYKLWSRNQWKRERLAPSFHLDDFNVDPKTWYRFPILSRGFEEEIRELETCRE